jgi:hypothetical protein
MKDRTAAFLCVVCEMSRSFQNLLYFEKKNYCNSVFTMLSDT